MKRIIKAILFSTVSLWLTTEFFPGVQVTGTILTLLFSGTILAVLTTLVLPLLKILFIPINIITFGLASWLMNVIILYLLTIFVSDVSIQTWRFPGYYYQGFAIPPYVFTYAFSLIIGSICITFFNNLLNEISE